MAKQKKSVNGSKVEIPTAQEVVADPQTVEWSQTPLEPEPVQNQWDVQEAGTPSPASQPVSDWSQPTEISTSEQWSQSPEPADIITQNPDEPATQWAGVESERTVDEAPVDPANDWGPNGAGTNMTLNIETHSGQFDPDIAKILIYGDTGTQKTRTASTFPDVIFMDVDHGMSSVTEHVDKVYIHDDENGFKEMQALYKFLREGDHAYTTVVLDTLNEMQRVIMRFTVEEYQHIRRSYGNLPGQSDYGKMLYEFVELTRAFISLPMRVVLLAQVNTQQFETDIISPQLIGKNSVRDLLRKMDVVGYIYKSQGADKTFPEMTFDSSQYATKDRSFKLPVTLPNPSYDRISSYWR